MKKVIMLCAMVMSSMMSQEQLSKVEFSELNLVFQQEGRFVVLYRGGNEVSKMVTPKGMPQDGATLLKMFSSSLTPSEKQDVAGWKSAVQSSTIASTNPGSLNIDNSPLASTEPSTLEESPALKGSSDGTLPEEAGKLEKNIVSGRLSQCMNYIKKQSLSAVSHVVINSQEYPMLTAAAVLVGGFGGFKAGEKIAQLAKFKKTGTRVTQVISTISGAALATVGTWALLNKWYQA